MIGNFAAALFAFSRGAPVGSARPADGFVETGRTEPACGTAKASGAVRIAAAPDVGKFARPRGTVRQVLGCGAAARLSALFALGERSQDEQGRTRVFLRALRGVERRAVGRTATLRRPPPERPASALPGAGFRAALWFCSLASAAVFAPALAEPALWKASWPDTDFAKKSVEFSEIRSGGPPKDGIPPIDRPQFVLQAEYRGAGESEPVIAFARGGDARAYPLRILIWHEIVNDVVGGIPVSVTYCPLCNSAIVFDRRLDGKVLDFGTTGKLRNSDLVMYDRQTESWWQQFTGEGIVGEMTGRRLRMLPARVESLSRFRARFPDGSVLVPNDPGMRPYGVNPYVGYDTSARPFLYDGDLPEGIAPLAYVVRVGDEAWPLETLRAKGRIVAGDLVLSWSSGRNSALDRREIGKGRDVGNVVVLRRTPKGLEEEVHDLTFAFVFHAFVEGGTLHE